MRRNVLISFVVVLEGDELDLIGCWIEVKAVMLLKMWCQFSELRDMSGKSSSYDGHGGSDTKTQNSDQC